MKISIILHDLRSAHNVGSILRSSDAFGVDSVFIGGYSPYPDIPGDQRLPHIRSKQTKLIAKTALGAEKSVRIEKYEDIHLLIGSLKKQGVTVLALEQDSSSTQLTDYHQKNDIAILIGREVKGIDHELLEECNDIIEIPMKGTKESLNVSVATAIALFHFAVQ